MKRLLTILGFVPKENTSNIFIKKFPLHNNYALEVDFEKEVFHFGGGRKIYDKDIQNITKPEDWVVFECVNRLLEKWYKPENIILEKVYPAGHGFSGRLDICVTRDDGSEYLLIECKTYGKEFDKGFARLKKDGWQLFTYFKFSNKADIIMLYASELQDDTIVVKNEIVQIKGSYRIGDVRDFFTAWNKVTYSRGVWENRPYDSTIQTFTKKNLKPLSKHESDNIFHGFAAILRKHAVSDKPNAFNKIFNLFLAKLYDEAKWDDMELEFHWRENDDPIDFQVRLINLHKNGLLDFLEKETEWILDSDFQYRDADELKEKKKKMLKFNNVFAIKDVLDDASFDENQRVLKDVVQLLEKYQIRYPRKQQYLSDFFELLLTTWLKQEVGQYFTPPPVTKFIMRSLPIRQMILSEINNQVPRLPAVIDYAAGSGHFITEALEEYQDIINEIDIERDLTFPNAKKEVKAWQANPYSWASRYMYGIEKDYRLVKVAKVGCYFYGDGVAQIIHGDGLDSFTTSKTYRWLLSENINIEDSSKAKFSLVVSNPPYAVNDCRDDLEYIGSQHEFSLYPSLSDKSRDIECLFVERTKHLLKDGGIASIILPSSILNNTGIQTRTREIILQYFDIIAIAEFGSNTFMATGTNTVTLFLRRRSNAESVRWRASVDIFVQTLEDITIRSIERPVAKYVQHVWEGISYVDYLTLMRQEPNSAIGQHEIYREYRKKLKVKTEKEFWSQVIARESDKILYYIIARDQRIVLIKSGEKETEKRFLGYEFKERRGGEGMHSMRADQTVDECTQMFDPLSTDNPEKASTYILRAFEWDTTSDIHLAMQAYVSRHDLVDMMTWDRVDFEKTISLSVKKKIKIESKWEMVRLGDVASFEYGNSLPDRDRVNGEYPVFGSNGIIGYHNTYTVEAPTLIIGRKGSAGKVNIIRENCFPIDTTFYLKIQSPKLSFEYCCKLFQSIESDLISLSSGMWPWGLNRNDAYRIKIPLPPLDIQQQIVDEIGILETLEIQQKERIKSDQERVADMFAQLLVQADTSVRLSDEDIFDVTIGKRVLKNEFVKNGKIPVYSANVMEPFGSIDASLITDFSTPSVLWGIDGDWMVNYMPAGYPFYPTDHCGVLRVDTGIIHPRYLAFVLEQEWKSLEFSRTKRASIDRIQGIKIPLPPLSEQQRIVNEIEQIEWEISRLKIELANIPAQKEAILKKYL